MVFYFLPNTILLLYYININTILIIPNTILIFIGSVARAFELRHFMLKYVNFSINLIRLL